MNSFEIGTTGSASQMMGAFESLRAQGQALMDALVEFRTSSLVDFEQKVEALNARRQRANRIAAPFTAAKFVVSDFGDFDQTLSSATIRADAQTATLKERPIDTRAVVQSQSFSISSGTAEAISSNQDLYRVQITDGSLPVGTFKLQMVDPLVMTVLTFDLAAMPPTPSFAVSASLDGTVYVPALRTRMNGYRLTAWFAPMPMKFIELAITPAVSDALGGDTYTFGLTDFVGSQTEFQMVSELVSTPRQIIPAGSQLKLVADEAQGIAYFVSFGGGTWQEYKAGDTVKIPGTAAFQLPDITVTHSGSVYVIGTDVLPASAYVRSVKIIDLDTNEPVRLAPGLSGVLAADTVLTHDYVAVQAGAQLNYLPAPGVAPLSKQFTLSYVTGPASVTVQIKVQISTADRTITPTFTGASLEEM